MNARQFLSRFAGVRKISGGWMVICPAHEDVNPSLKVAEGDHGGVVIFCHAGCSNDAVTAAMGLKVSDLFADAPPPAVHVPTKSKAATAPKLAPVAKPKGNPVYKGQQDFNIKATYDYRDTDGTLLYQVVRKEPKQFLQRRPDGEGGWIWKVAKQVKRVPYRLPELLAVPTVFVVEGEKDADRLWNMGIPATCNAGGAGKWGASESKALAAACVQRVIIVPDNDEAGVKHAHDVAAKCKRVGLAVSVVELPGLNHHGDVSDWLDADGTKDGLMALAAVPYVLPPPKGGQPLPQGYSGPIMGSGAGPGSVDSGASGAVELEPFVEPGPDALANPTSYASPHGNGEPGDIGAAEAFRDRYGDRVRYDHSRDQWFIWAGHYWKPDNTEQVRKLAMDHVRLWRGEVAKALHYSKRSTLQAYLAKLERKQGIENMLTCATWLEPISTDGKQWDRNTMLLGVRNGVIDLATGALLPGAKDQHITLIAPFDYDPHATAPRWEQFIGEVFSDDTPLMMYVQMALGYSLTGDMREQVFFLCVGTGSNGKSIFLDTLETVFGDYGHRAKMEVFTGDAAKFHLAEMRSKRLITASETKQNTRLQEDVIKNFTGGETLSAEKKGGQPFTFQPVGKIWMGVNHEPKVADDSFGFWRRVRLVPFMRTFGTDADPMLRDKLKAEAPGILRWCIEGCLGWQEMGKLHAPESVLSATEKYQQHENPLAEFFAERCRLDADATTTTSAIMASYTTWCDEQGIRSYDRLARRSILSLLEKQFTIVNVDGVNRVRGIEIKNNSLF